MARLASGTLFKRTNAGRKSRVLLPDGNFSKGMRYSDSFLEDNNVKLLVNHRLMDQGSYLSPRKGIRGSDFKLGTINEVFTDTSKIPAPQIVYYGVYKDSDGFDKFGNVVISFGVPDNPGYAYYLTEKDALVPDYYNKQKLQGHAFGRLEKDDDVQVVLDVTGLKPAKTQFYLDNPRPLYCIFDYKLYYMGYSGSASILCEVTIEWDDATDTYKAVATMVTPKTIPLSEATSIGFNMFLTNPYDFDNVADITLSVTGLLPYKPGTSTLLLSSNLGEEIEFEAFYKYKTGETYRAQFEYSAYGSSEFKVVQAFDFATYLNGARCTMKITPTDSKFVLRVTMVPLDSGGVQLDELSKVAIYPLYTMGVASLKDAGSENYEIHKARGLAAHNDMLCVWGVPGVESALFFSDIMEPAYFPFPHNVFYFTEPILGVKSFSGALFVFTERTLYYIEGYSMYEMAEPRKIYENLQFTKEDVLCCQIVKNGMMIRSDNKYYMIIPNVYTGLLSDLRIVLVSTPIESLLSDFNSFLKLLSHRLYKFDVSWSEYTTIKLYDFFNYVDSNVVKNVYRYVVFEQKTYGLVRYQIDVIVAYNTELGVWFTEVASFPFNGIVAQGSVLYTTYLKKGAAAADLYLQKLGYWNSDCVDEYNTAFYGDAVNDNSTSAREAELASYPAVGQDIVVRVVDGDTVELETLGKVRLHYVNTPESTTTVEPYGVTASNWLKEHLPIGSVVTFRFDGPRADRYGRVLCWLFKGDSNASVQVSIAVMGFVKSVYDFQATNMTYINQVEAALADSIADKRGLYANLQPDGPFYVRTAQSASLLGNFQILDTGNRNQEPYIKKRYKEIQFLMSNDSASPIYFYTEIYIDSIRKKTPFSYELIHETDPDSEDYGTIYVVENEESNMVAGNETALDFLELDVSMFPDLEIIKIVFRFTGLGHYPRCVLVSRNQDSHKILGYSWVLRPLNAR